LGDSGAEEPEDGAPAPEGGVGRSDAIDVIDAIDTIDTMDILPSVEDEDDPWAKAAAAKAGAGEPEDSFFAADGSPESVWGEDETPDPGAAGGSEEVSDDGSDEVSENGPDDGSFAAEPARPSDPGDPGASRGSMEIDETGLNLSLDDLGTPEEPDAEDSWDRVVPDGGPDATFGETPEAAPVAAEAIPEGIPEGTGTGELPPDSRGKEAPGIPKDPGEAGHEVDRTRFLESLLEDGEKVPRKVELDLDGIFTQAKEEADKLSPDSTHPPVKAPSPGDDVPAPPPEPLSEPKVRKVSKFKFLVLIAPIVVGVLGLGIGVYEIFLKSPPKVEEPLIVIDPDFKKEPVPGEMTLERFYLTLEDPDDVEPAVAELEIILHYRDAPDAGTIDANRVALRDMIFRITKATGKPVLTDSSVRRQLQADLLTTLNELPYLKEETENGARGILTYVQISRLRKI
jgi:hypothetical protein